MADDVAVLAHRCRLAGLDLHATTTVGRYNDRVAGDLRLPGSAASLVVVIGNTAALWPVLDAAMRATPGPIADPVDEHVVRVIDEAATIAFGAAVVDIRYAHEPPPRRVAIQQLADIAGLAWLAPSHLCVHPVFGPWIALRAAVVVDREPSEIGQPLEPQCECAAHCLPKLDAALAAGEPTTSAELRNHWQRWLAMRDACPVGRDHRYGDAQIRYHYLGERPAGWPPA
jgi:methylmalonic aciduria homocystinuria type C protein